MVRFGMASNASIYGVSVNNPTIPARMRTYSRLITLSFPLLAKFLPFLAYLVIDYI